MRTDDPSYIVALDAGNGKEIWREARATDAVWEFSDSYTTPALLKHDGKTQIVITGGDCVTGHDTETGREIWRAYGLNPEQQGNYRLWPLP